MVADLMTGKPEFHEGYSNPDAAEGGIIEFPYDQIDGIMPEEETDFAVVASALVGVMLFLVGDGLQSRNFGAKVLSRFDRLKERAGLGAAEPDRSWALQWVDNARQAEMLLQALRRVLPVFELSGRRVARSKAGLREGVVSKNAVAFAWICSPSIFHGKGLNELAEAIGAHKNTLSQYSANLSREFGHRTHAQSKGWNWRA